MDVLQSDTPNYFKMLLVLIGCSLSSVTAISVGMAMFSLIDNIFIAALFAAAAVMLDLFKYLAWPVSISMWSCGYKACALLMMMSATLLGAVSGWATYDRLHGSMLVGQIRYASVQGDIAELKEIKGLELDRLNSVDRELQSLSEQARQLRERGMVSKAQDLDSVAIASAAAQRQQIMMSVEKISRDINVLQSKAAPSAGLSTLMLILICAGFAFSLEVVPALIGAALRAGNAALKTVDDEADPLDCSTQSSIKGIESITQTCQDVVQPATAPATLSLAPTTGQQQELFGSDDPRLMKTLIQMTQSTMPGTPIKVRDFTALARVGNRRTIKLFHEAMEVGLLKRTSNGYVAA